jgi:hypothetical protein
LNLHPAHAEDATNATAAEAFCEAAAVVSKSIGPDKDAFMAWCKPEAVKLIPTQAQGGRRFRYRCYSSYEAVLRC